VSPSLSSDDSSNIPPLSTIISDWSSSITLVSSSLSSLPEEVNKYKI